MEIDQYVAKVPKSIKCQSLLQNSKASVVRSADEGDGHVLDEANSPCAIGEERTRPDPLSPRAGRRHEFCKRLVKVSFPDIPRVINTFPPSFSRRVVTPH